VLPAISLYSPENSARASANVGRFLAVWNPSKRQVLSYVSPAYATTIFLFAVVFLLINNFVEDAFTPRLPRLGAASYFSVVTIATVGYGDILPVSGWARFAVSTEILVGVGYTVLFFSVVAGFLRERPR
jgi:Ion channel